MVPGVFLHGETVWRTVELITSTKPISTTDMNSSRVEKERDRTWFNRAVEKNDYHSRHYAAFGINFLNHSVSLIHISHLCLSHSHSPAHIRTPFSLSVIPSLFHFRLKTSQQVLSTVDSCIDNSQDWLHGLMIISCSLVEKVLSINWIRLGYARWIKTTLWESCVSSR